jgi:carbon storage regulator
MLVLTRKKNQSIMIGNSIEIKILEVSGRNVSIGIEAPRDVEIFREELISKNSDENQAD